MQLSSELQPIELGDLTTNKALHTVAARCLALRADYWDAILDNAPQCDMITIFFQKAQKQVEVLKEIIRSINKGIIPGDALLKQLPYMLASYAGAYQVRKQNGYADADMRPEMKKQIKDGARRVFVLYTSSPIDVKEDKVQFSAFATRDDGGGIHSLMLDNLKKYDEDFFDYLKNHQVAKEPPIEIKRQLWDMLNHKKCAACKAESATKRCTACGTTYYCNAECQLEDWPAHKTICPTLRIMKMMMSSDPDILTDNQ